MAPPEEPYIHLISGVPATATAIGVRNNDARTAMRTQIKKVRAAVEAKDVDSAKTALPKALSAIANTTRKGAINHKTASRYTSRLTKLVNRANS